MRARSVRVPLPGEARDCAFHPNHDLLFSGAQDGQLCCHKLEEPSDVLECLHVQVGYSGPGFDDCFIQAQSLWERELDNGERGACRALALSKDGETVAMGTASNEIIIVDTEQGRKKRRILDEEIFEPVESADDPEQGPENSLHRLSYMGQHLVSGVHSPAAPLCTTRAGRRSVLRALRMHTCTLLHRTALGGHCWRALYMSAHHSRASAALRPPNSQAPRRSRGRHRAPVGRACP